MIDQFMIGRGALRNPFLPGEIKGITYNKSEKQSKMIAFHQSVYHYYQSNLSGDKHLLDRMKEFWTYTAYHFDQHEEFVKRLKKCHTSSAYLGLVQQFLSASNVAK